MCPDEFLFIDFSTLPNILINFHCSILHSHTGNLQLLDFCKDFMTLPMVKYCSMTWMFKPWTSRHIGMFQEYSLHIRTKVNLRFLTSHFLLEANGLVLLHKTQLYSLALFFQTSCTE